jgi:hypothetical protein
MVVISFVAVIAAWIAIFVSQRKIRQQEESLHRLMRRVWELEQRGTALPEVVAKPVAPEPVAHFVPVPPPLPVPQALRVAQALPVAQARQTTKNDGLPHGKPRSSVEWETLIGGNILNKLGALLFVIGVMSFLGYYGTHMSPAGRAGLAVLVSVGLLGVGIWLERRENYRLFARGLMGAGWAALYATAYAMYALPAARVISNSFIGSALVLLVAAGMIAHSLRYRAQGVTAVAFFSAFAALAITPSTLFGVLALIPLAAAVLYLAQRFNWYHMALMGVFATYGACASHGSSGAPLMESETLFIFYWALFEIFDLMRFSSRVRGWAVELIFPLNCAGFLGLSYASWTAKSPETLWMLSGCAALLYALSTLWRLKIEADRGFDQTADLPARIRSGNFEAPLSVGAFLVAVAIVQKLTGMWESTALAMEAETLFMAGVRFRSRWLRGLAVCAFVPSLLNIAVTAALNPAQVNLLGHMTHKWALLLLFEALLFYVNRAVSQPGSRIGRGFSWAASLLVMVAAGQELSVGWIGSAWLAMAAILFETGMRKQLREFRWQAYAMGFCGWFQSVFFVQEVKAHQWAALAIAAAFTYACAWRSGKFEAADPDRKEWRWVGWFACAGTTLAGMVLIFVQTQNWFGSDKFTGAVELGLAILLLELGLRHLPWRLRRFSYAVAAFAFLGVSGANASHFVKHAEQAVWLSYLAAACAAWIMSVRLTATSDTLMTARERQWGRSILAGFGLMFALCGSWVIVPDTFVPAVWAAIAYGLLEAGNALHVPAYGWLAQAGAGIAAFFAFFFTLPDGHPQRILATVLLIAFLVAFRIKSIAAAGPYHIAASALLAAALIYQEVSGSMLTIAWGAEALVLLGAGFTFRERSSRLQGLGLFLICVLKLFFYDLRNLDMPFRILSFIALGLILLGVSWIYTRFRSQLQKLL